MQKYERIIKVGSKSMRESKMSDADWTEAVDTDALQYVYVPDEKKTYALTKLAVSLYGWNLRWTPKEHLTEEVIDLAVIEDPESIVFLKEPPCRHQVEAVMANPYVITLIQHPCDDAVAVIKKRSPQKLAKMFMRRKLSTK